MPAYGSVNEEPPVPVAHQEVMEKESSAVATVYLATTDQVQQNIDPVLPSVASPEPPIVAENKPEPLLVDNKQGVVSEDSAVASADNQWYELLPKLGLGGMAKQFAEHCLFKEQFDDKVVLLLDNTGVTLQSSSTEAALAKSLSQYFGREIHLAFDVSDSIGETPEKRRIRLGKERQQAAERSIEQDLFVNELCEKWGGVVLPGSVRPHLNVDTF